ncbi:hypothetical protein QR680_004547 [Steinernema hermaphroditum]|uniref:DH domain-containing protein n=1 Tax=Steinernema hermaphroditum TaxID=289476 RepID=A0AA39LTD3_9BILA|nr:hypothetical protein QR680_004547 [Steinernema hermaphroditum]
MNSKMMQSSTKKTAGVHQQKMQNASGAAVSSDSSKVYFIIDELVDTERTFGDDLQQVLEGYYYYFVENDMRYNISVCDLKSVFGGLETIYNFSRKLYEAIDRVSYSLLKTARTFLKFSIGFNDYVLYCTAYERTIARLNQMLENKLFAKAVEVQQQRLGHSLPLASYLLKPVQRVLKYHLFWDKIMKQWNRPPALSLEEKFYVRKAFESMTQLAENINSEKKRCDRIERVVQLQSRIINFPLDEIPMPSQGELLLDGSLKMLNSKSRRYLFLYERVFLMTKEQNGYFLCKACIPTANMMINDTVLNHPMAFEVISFGVTSSRHAFDAETMNVKQQWVKEVKRIMFDHCAVKITRPNFRGYSFGGAMGLPKSRPISTVSEVNIGSKPEVSLLPKKTYSFTPAKRKEHRHIRFEKSAPAKLESKEEFVAGAIFARMLDERYANGYDEHEDEDMVAKYWLSSPHIKTGYRRSRSSLVAEQIRRKKLEKANRDI